MMVYETQWEIHLHECSDLLLHSLGYILWMLLYVPNLMG